MASRSRDLKVIIAGDADKLNRELKKSDRALDKFGKQTRVTSSITSKGFAGMRVAAVGAGAAIGGVVIAGRSFVNAALEAEKSQAKLTAQLKASDISYDRHAKQIESVIQKHSRLAGLDDEDLTDAFTNIVRVTGNVDKSLRLTGLAADFARAKHMDVAKAGELVGKVAGGNIGILGRYGIKIKEGSTATEALGQLQQKFAGQAEAYGRTNAGAADRAQVAYENLKETIGGALAPVVGRLANRFAKFATEMQNGTGQGGRFVEKLKAMWTEAKPVVTWIGRATANVAKFVGKHPEIGKLAAAVIGVGVAVKALRFVSAATGFTTLLKAGRSVMRKMVSMFVAQGAVAGAGAGTAAAGSQGLTGTGRFNAMRRAGGRLGRVMGRGLMLGAVAGLVLFIPDLVKAITGIDLLDAGKKLGSKIWKGAKSVIPFGDGIGVGKITAGKGSASLQGANSALAPIAAVGRRFGLGVSSGLRPGAITSSNNQSFHSTGEAVDLSGPPGGMMRTFRALKSTMGSRLAELIYTPGGTGIKNGRPHRYSGKVAADHHDHVHAALDLGRPGPGIGDGIGEAARAGRAAGFRGRSLIEMVAIAGPESNYRNKARLVTSREDSRGMWQINTLAHPWARSLNLSNPVVAARAARKVWLQAGRSWRPWTGYTSGAYRSFLDDARRAVAGSRGAAAPSARGGSRRGSSGRTNPYELASAEADLAIAQAEGAGTITVGGRRVGPALQQIQANIGKRDVVSARIRKIRRALRKKQSPANRLRLTTELAGLLGEHRQLGETIRELKAGPEREDIGGDVGGDGEDPNQALIDAINAKADQDRELAEEAAQRAEELQRLEEERAQAVRELQAEIARSNAIAESTVGIGLREAQRALADMISGQLGYKTGGRVALAGSGSLARY